MQLRPARRSRRVAPRAASTIRAWADSLRRCAGDDSLRVVVQFDDHRARADAEGVRVSLPSLAARLPDVQTLIAWSQSMAMLDAILSPEWDMRHFSHDARWAPGEHMASMRNGSGDEYSFTITRDGVYGRGFDHESALSPFTRRPPRPYAGLLDIVPDVLREAVEEPSFTLDDVPLATLTLWRLDGDGAWSHGEARDVITPSGDDGGTWLFDGLDGKPETYLAFATGYYEVPLNHAAVSDVFQHVPLTDAVVRALNADVAVEDLIDDVRSIGYPPQ